MFMFRSCSRYMNIKIDLEMDFGTDTEVKIDIQRFKYRILILVQSLIRYLTQCWTLFSNI
jgi:hypothetical protein